MTFWDDLFASKKMVLGLSPMDGVTDVAMRYMTAKYGGKSSDHSPRIAQGSELWSGVDVLFTEFVSVDALKHAKEEKSVERIMRAFQRAQDIGELEKPPYEIAQMFGHTPELFYQAAVMIATLGFDGMDINMGCPMHKVEDQGSGAGLIRTPEIAQEIIRQSRKGMEDFAVGKVSLDDLAMSQAIKNWVKKHAPAVKSSGPLPISVKTRIGVTHDVAEEWMTTLMEVSPEVISLHGRTLRQLYQGSADWDSIGRAAEIVHKHGGHLLGNGDVENLKDAEEKVKQYSVDGILIGRAAEGNPGVFVQSSDHSPIVAQGSELWKQRQFAWMIEHARVFEKLFAERVDLSKSEQSTLRDQPSKSFMPMRKHLAWYCKGFPGAVELRIKLMQTNSASEVEEIVKGVV